MDNDFDLFDFAMAQAAAIPEPATLSEPEIIHTPVLTKAELRQAAMAFLAP